jgi:hypothetical protein
MLNLRIRLDYGDQNEAFGKLLPRTGSIIKMLKTTTDGCSWAVLKFDEPFEYQTYGLPGRQFSTFNCEHALIRSRWVGHEIGQKDPVNVFILIAFDENAFQADVINLEQFHHVAWGICTRLD